MTNLISYPPISAFCVSSWYRAWYVNCHIINSIYIWNSQAILKTEKVTALPSRCNPIAEYFPVSKTWPKDLIKSEYTTARVFVLRIRVLCAFPTRCTCVEFKLRMKRESTYFETHEYSLAALQRVSTIKYAFLPLANQIVLLQRSGA